MYTSFNFTRKREGLGDQTSFFHRGLIDQIPHKDIRFIPTSCPLPHWFLPWCSFVENVVQCCKKYSQYLSLPSKSSIPRSLLLPSKHPSTSPPPPILLDSHPSHLPQTSEKHKLEVSFIFTNKTKHNLPYWLHTNTKFKVKH